jgi:hypothetical protein
VVIVDGCSCLYEDDLAQAFVQKGASCYLVWDATANLDYVDQATAYLVKQLCVKKVSIANAVANTMKVVGPDPEYGAVLKYYPQQSSSKALKELIFSST